MKKVLILFFIFVIVFTTNMQASGPTTTLTVESYIYNRGGSRFYHVPAPSPYRWYRSVSAADIGIGALTHIGEILYHDNKIFIINGSSIVVVNSEDFNLIQEITGVYINGDFTAFQPLDGIFITDNGEIYVAEPNGNRVWHLDSDFNYVRQLGRPEGIPIPENLSFVPRKVVVDNHGRIYIISENIFEGLVELNPDGTFNRYFGTIEVQVTAAQLFWRSIQSAAQRARTSLWLPTTFTNVAIDNDGFVYTTLTSPGRSPVMKLNPRGGDILRSSHDDFLPGAMQFNSWGLNIPTGPSILNFLHVTDFGVYYVFDTVRNRIYAYDDDGYMLFAFGGSGTRNGLTLSVTGMTVTSGDLLILADRATNSLEVFERTEYGHMLINAARLQYDADWEGAAEYWQQIIDYNPYYQYAYLGMGRYLYRTGRASEAVHYFQMAQSVEYFSRAFQQQRLEFIESHFNIIAIGLAVIVFGIIGIRSARKIRKKEVAEA